MAPRIEQLEPGLVEALRELAAYPLEPPAANEVTPVQTHLSHAFPTPDRVYNLHKAVDLGFVSFATQTEPQRSQTARRPSHEIEKMRTYARPTEHAQPGDTAMPEVELDSKTLTPELRERMDAGWRAANFLSVDQIYPFDNPLLRRPPPPRPAGAEPWLRGARFLSHVRRDTSLGAVSPFSAPVELLS